jgi:saccharopine dehydrogenase-like NADP-dependent oxidoreductase
MATRWSAIFSVDLWRLTFMKVLILGLGQQGRAALYHLAGSSDVCEIIAADSDLERAKAYAGRFGRGKARCVRLDADDHSAVLELMSSGVDVVINLLPVYFTEVMIELALEAGVHLVNTCYASEAVLKLDAEAARKGVAILPEFGMDPGIDLVMGARAVGELDEVQELYSYGAGLPEPEAADNPIKYKIAWTFDGVLRSYKRPARILKDGEVIHIPATDIFTEGNIHTVHVDGLGELEAIPNGDALKYRDLFGLRGSLRAMGRFSLRYPGHCAFWKKLVDLRFLDDEPITVGSAEVVPREFLYSLLEPQLQYSENERDVAFIRIDARGLKAGRRTRIVYDLIDYRDLSTGLMAMNRTVGFTASIGAQMIVRGDIARRGVLSPTRDVDSDTLFGELRKCGIRISRSEEPW